MAINVLASLAMGLFFGLAFWFLNNMQEASLFNAIAFALGAIAEACRRWVVST